MRKVWRDEFGFNAYARLLLVEADFPYKKKRDSQGSYRVYVHQNNFAPRA